MRIYIVLILPHRLIKYFLPVIQARFINIG